MNPDVHPAASPAPPFIQAAPAVTASNAAASVPARRDFRHLEPLRVRWAEVDLQHIVFNGHYLMYFDTAVAGHWRAMAVPYHAAMQSLGGDLYVRKATVEYLASARFDDGLRVGVRTQRIGRSSMQLICAVFLGEQALVHGDLLYVYANPATQTSEPVPEALRELCAAFERGDDMVRVMKNGASATQAAVQSMRATLREPELTAAATWAESDSGAQHVVLQNRLDMPVASARVSSPRDGVCEWGALAVNAGLRGGRLVEPLLKASADAAAQLGGRSLQIEAPVGLVAHLLSLGFMSAAPAMDGRTRLRMNVA